jgi:hypothetical protein
MDNLNLPIQPNSTASERDRTEDSSTMPAEINSGMAAHVPQQVWSSTVAIVIANRPHLYQFGTGILFQIADSCFVVTAAYNIRVALGSGKTLGITAGDSFVALGGESVIPTPFQHGSVEDHFDVAIHELSSSAAGLLKDKQFLQMSDVRFGALPSTAVVTMCGFPKIMTIPATVDNRTPPLKPFEYTSSIFDGDDTNLIGYDPKYHFLLDARPGQLTADDSWPAEVQSPLRGGRAAFPDDIKGVSGYGMWMIGDLTLPLSEWPQHKRLVGVETSMYPSRQAIRGTKWAAVTTLIYDEFPSLRPAINLWRQA